jgi:lipopolysaccharide transport system permease protein
MIVQPGSIAVSPFVFITPLLLIIMGLLGLSLGLLISSVTTKYRDFIQLVAFGVQLLMYATPVVYPMSILSAKYQALLFFNPMTGVIETFRYIFIGSGTLNWTMLGYSAFMSILLLIVAVIVFNRVEKGFIDTV